MLLKMSALTGEHFVGGGYFIHIPIEPSCTVPGGDGATACESVGTVAGRTHMKSYVMAEHAAGRAVSTEAPSSG